MLYDAFTHCLTPPSACAVFHTTRAGSLGESRGEGVRPRAGQRRTAPLSAWGSALPAAGCLLGTYYFRGRPMGRQGTDRVRFSGDLPPCTRGGGRDPRDARRASLSCALNCPCIVERAREGKFGGAMYVCPNCAWVVHAQRYRTVTLCARRNLHRRPPPLPPRDGSAVGHSQAGASNFLEYPPARTRKLCLDMRGASFPAFV